MVSVSVKSELEGRVAVITGGCSGFGAAAVDLFVEAGAKVVIVDIQDELGVQKQAALSGSVKFVHCDVTSETEYAAAIQLAHSEFGGLDILFNNAGAIDAAHHSIETMTPEDWDWVMSLNLRAGVMGMKHAVPLMRQRGGGSVIHTASIAGQRTGISTVAYSVSKAALIHLTRMASAEFAKDNIRVNAICPGTIPTAAFEKEFGISRENMEKAKSKVNAVFATAQPLPQAGSANDIAEMALFLASDKSKFLTGQDITVDGGMTQMPPPSLVLTDENGVLQQMMRLSAEIADQ